MKSFGTAKPSHGSVYCTMFTNMGAATWFHTMQDRCLSRCEHNLPKNHVCQSNCRSCCHIVAYYQVRMYHLCCRNPWFAPFLPPPPVMPARSNDPMCNFALNLLNTTQSAARARFPKDPCIIDAPTKDDCDILLTGSDSKWRAHRSKKKDDCYDCCRENHPGVGDLATCFQMCNHQLRDWEFASNSIRAFRASFSWYISTNSLGV